MKKEILLSVFTIITAFSFAQNKEKVTLKNDTLFIPVGTCNYIKIGDKVYKVKVTLEEVQEPEGIFLAPQSFKAYPSDNLLLRLNPNMGYDGYYDKYTTPAIIYSQSDSAHIINIPYHSIQ
jgi:hypothetical protein